MRRRDPQRRRDVQAVRGRWRGRVLRQDVARRRFGGADMRAERTVECENGDEETGLRGAVSQPLLSLLEAGATSSKVPPNVTFGAGWVCARGWEFFFKSQETDSPRLLWGKVKRRGRGNRALSSYFSLCL